MTPRPTPPRGGRTLSASDYPTLESFFSGYLHEDYVEDHGSPQGALSAFRTDADAGERERFALEAAALLDASAALPFDVVVEFIQRDLGAAWRPTEFHQLERLLGHGGSRHGAGSGESHRGSEGTRGDRRPRRHD